MMKQTRIIGLLAALLLTACTGLKPAQAPDVVIPNANVGGSIVAFNAASTQLASGGWDGDLQLWSLPDGKPLRHWSAHVGTVNGIAFLDHDRRILTGGYDGEFAEWDAQGKQLRRMPAGSPITAMTVNEQDNIVITGHADGAVRVWRLDSLQRRYDYPAHKGAVRAVAYLPGQQRIASSGTDTRAFLWRSIATPPMALPSPPTDSRALQFSPDGQWLIGSGWFRLFRWNVASGALTVIPTEHNGIIKSIQYSPDGRYLASISRQTDSSIYFLDPMTGKVLRRFARHDLCGGWIALSPDQHYIATTSDDASVRIWWLGGGDPIKNPEPQGHQGS
jgi:WD40 repeat protein